MHENLDKFQRQYYDEPLTKDKAVLLYAVAGSGKTHTTIAKAIKLIQQDNIDPKRILLTSFTNISARELMQRFSKNCETKDKPLISTLHGFGRYLLKHSNITRYSITEWGAILRMRDALLDRLPAFSNQYKRDQTSVAASIYQTYSKLRNGSIVFKHTLDYDLAKLQLKHDILTDAQIKSVITQYEKIKDEQSVMDYDDMLWLPNSEFRQGNSQMQELADQIDYFFIDEAQDLSQSQYDLILNCSQHKSLTLIGDLCQSIYGFRDATPENFSKQYLQSYFKDITELALQNNYRSTPAIVKVSNLVRTIAEDIIQATPVQSDTEGSVKVVQARNNVTEGRYVVDRINELLLEYEAKDIIVICRTNRHIKSVLEPAFVSANIKYQIVGGNNGKKLLDKPLAQFYLDCISYLVNDKDYYSLVSALSQIKGIGASHLPAIQRELNSGNLQTKQDQVGQIMDLLALVRLDIGKNVYKVISGITNLAQNFCLASTNVSEKNIDTISLSLSNYISLQKDNNPDITNLEILENVLSEVNVFESESDSNVIRLATVHSQKGAEAKVVFCAGFNTQNPSGYMSDKDEANILYVQLSRAIEKLFIVDSKEYVNRAGITSTNYKNPYLSKLFKILTGD